MSWDCHQGLSGRQPSLFYQLRCCAARAAQQCRRPQQAPPARFLASRSKRRSRWQGRIGRGMRRTPLHLAGYRQPLERRRPRQVQYWGRLPGLREPAAVATAVAKPALNVAVPPGSDVVLRRAKIQSQVSRQRARTHSPTKLTWTARTPKSFWVGCTEKPGGIAAACLPAGSLSGRGIGSPNSSDHGAASPYPHWLRFNESVAGSGKACRAVPRGLSLGLPEEQPKDQP